MTAARGRRRTITEVAVALGVDAVLTAGVPAGLLRRPVSFFRTPKGRALHSRSDCPIFVRSRRRKAALPVEVPYTEVGGRLCGKCWDAPDKDVADYLDVAKLLVKTRHLLAKDDVGAGRRADLHRVAAMLRSATKRPHLSELAELCADAADAALRHAAGADVSEHMARAARSCAVQLAFKLDRRTRPPSPARYANSTEFGDVFSAWTTAFIAGATVEAAHEAIASGVEAEPEPTRFDQVPAVTRFNAADFATMRDWAVAEWRAAADDELRTVTEEWRAAATQVLAEPGQIVVISDWDTESSRAAGITASLGAIAHVAPLRRAGWFHLPGATTRWLVERGGGRIVAEKDIMVLGVVTDLEGAQMVSIAAALHNSEGVSAEDAFSSARLLSVRPLATDA